MAEVGPARNLWLVTSGVGALLLLISSAIIVLHMNPYQGVDKNPVRSAAEDEITHLPGYVGRRINFKHYSGYVAGDELEPTNKFLHFWLVESQSRPAEDPLVLWLNGGPCCSSLAGLLTEIGPFKLAANSSSRLVENEFAWNKRANVLFLETPVGTGFSYAADGELDADDEQTARQNYVALANFMRKFPQFNQRPLYLTGQSYAGVYLPTLAVLLNKDEGFNLRGVAIGNGFMDKQALDESILFYNYHHGLIGQSTWANISRHCCRGREPAPGQCKFAEFAECEHSISPKRYPKDLNYYNYLAESIADGAAGKTDLDEYLRRPEVTRALHIASNSRHFERCNFEIAYSQVYPHKPDGLAPQMRLLIKSPRNLTLLSYNGDLDLACNFLGVEQFIDKLKRPVVRDHVAWRTRGQISGFVKYYDRITFLTVKGAGHFVPADKPAEAQNMFHMFLDGMTPPE